MTTGSDGGADVTTTGDVASEASATTSDAGGTFTNVGPVDFTGTGDVVITSQSARLRTAMADIVGASTPASAYKFMEVDQAGGAPRLAVYIARSFRIEASALARVDGPNPVALVALDKIEVFGTLSGSGQRSTATAGGSAGTTTGKGGGPGGGGPSNSYSAGGGGSFCGIGGAGNAVSGIAAGVGGPAYGSPSLVPLLGGSSGGGQPANGGAGGGAIQLTAAGSVTIGIAGIVEVGGGGGAGNACAGGSGGAILIEAPVVTVAGILAANGGSGAASTGGPYGQDGQPGSTPAAGAATAGVGSAADMIEGGAGSITGTNVNSSGSGGGGAGRIRINSTGGSATLSGTISPGITTPCFSQGQI